MIVKPRSNRKPLYIVLAVILVLLLSGLAYSYKNNLLFFEDKTTTNDNDAINLEPPTEEDRKEVERNKQRLVEEDEQQEAPKLSGNTKQKVTPIIGYIQQSDNKNVEANGYVPQVVENDGTCTLTLEKQGQKVTESKRALPDAQGTVCGLLSIKRNRLSAGEWKATITYSSTKYQGTSEERSIKVE